MAKAHKKQDNIRNTPTQVLRGKGFQVETLPVLVTTYGQNVIPITYLLYYLVDSYVHTVPSVKRTRATER